MGDAEEAEQLFDELGADVSLRDAPALAKFLERKAGRPLERVPEAHALFLACFVGLIMRLAREPERRRGTEDLLEPEGEFRGDRRSALDHPVYVFKRHAQTP